MAVVYSSLYPTQVDTGDLANYPQGKAQNITTPGDGTGFPLEKQWVNDLIGLLASILDEGGVSPNGSPDSIGNPQYLTALKNIIAAPGVGTRYNIGEETSAAPNYNSTNHMTYAELTNVGAITATFQSATNTGDSVVLEKGVGSGAVTIQGDVGITVEVKVGETLSLSTDGEVASFISKDPTTWKMIK